MKDPVATPTASSHGDHTGRSGGGSSEIRGRKVVPPAFPSAPPSRISSAQLDLLDRSLSAEAQTVLLVLAEVRLATGHQLARRLWSSENPTDSRARLARQTLGRLERLRVLERLPRRMGGVRGGSASIVYGLGPAGRRLLTRRGFQSRRFRAPGERYVAHHLATTELTVQLFEADRDGELDLIETKSEPECWRPFLGVMGARVILKPDLFVRIGAGALEDRWFVEVDLATESVATIAVKAKVYLSHYRGGSEQARHGIYPRVIWTVPDVRRGEQIAEALGRLPTGTERLFVIWPYAEVVGRLAAEART
jgi:hypothetical protein